MIKENSTIENKVQGILDQFIELSNDPNEGFSYLISQTARIFGTDNIGVYRLNSVKTELLNGGFKGKEEFNGEDYCIELVDFLKHQDQIVFWSSAEKRIVPSTSGAISFIVVPVRKKNQLKGFILLSTSSGKQLDEHEIKALNKIASMFALIIDEICPFENVLMPNVELSVHEKAGNMDEEAAFHFKSLYINSPLPYQSLNDNGEIIECNPAWLNLFGYKKEEVIGIHFSKFLTDSSANTMLKSFPVFKKNGSVTKKEFDIVTKGGEARRVSFDGKILYDSMGQFIRTHCICKDITTEKIAENKLKKANRLYSVISQINQMIIHAQSREEVFQKACDIVVAYGGFCMAWVGVIEQDNNHFKPVACAGDNLGYLNKVTISFVDDNEEGKGPSGKSFREGTYSVSNDIANDPKMKPWREHALNSGFRSSIGLPIILNGKTAGTFSLYAPEPFYFDTEEIRLLKEVASDISFAIEVIEKEGKRKFAENALRESERKLSTLIGNFPGMVYRCKNDRDWTMEFLGGDCYGLTGYKIDDLIGNKKVSYNSLIGEDYREIVWREWQDALKKRENYQGEYPIITAQGEQKWVLENGCGVYSNSGELIALEGFVADITHLKIAEQEKQENAKKFSEFMNNLPGMAFIKDKDQRHIFVNKEVEKFSGISADQWSGKTLEDFLPGKHNLHLQELGEKVLCTGQPVWDEVEITVKGHDYTFMSTKFPIKLPGKEVLLGNVSIDITEKKQIEKALKYSKEEYLRFFEEDLSGDFIASAEGKLIDCNTAYLRIFGFLSKEEAKSYNLLNLYSFKGTREKLVKDLRSEKKLKDYHYKMTRLDGTIINVVANIVGEFNEQGELVVIKGYIIDDTERKKAEDQLKKLSRAVDQSPLSIVITDSKGNIEYVNPRFVGLTGYTFEEAIGANPRILKSGETPYSIYKDMWESIANGKDWFGELKNKKKDGSFYWESVSISPIINRNGEITNFVSVKEDITEKKNREKELIIAKEKAEQSDRLKSSFLANMSHEIRTPLNAIMGYSDLLNEPDLSENEHQTFLQVIQRSGDQLLSIINDIIDISKIEAGLMDIHVVPVSFNDILFQLQQQFKLQVLQKGIKLNFKYGLKDSDDYIMSDSVRITQILTNLINNALKFTSSGEINVRYNLIDSFLHVAVEDTGIGISKENQSEIFKQFQQVEDSQTRKYGGTGLGLSITKALVEKLGGKIWVDSVPGKGSKFTFTIPYTKVEV